MNTEWKLVPVEPTDEMWAAVNKLDDEMAAGGYDGKGASIEQVWNCLVDAAPGAPAVDGWLDIASAPKTGRTLLLGYWNSLGKWRTVRGQWVSLEHIAEHWEDPDEAETGWFETAVEADDVPNCWPVGPSHWQPMPAPPCPTCNDQGAVGNILTAEPCPDCSPPAPTSHPIPTGATGEEKDGLAEAQRLAQALFQRHFSQDDDYVSGRVKWEVLDDLPGVLSQIDNMVSGLVQPAAPAADDALARAQMFRHQLAHERAKIERLIAILVGIHNLTLPAPVVVDGKTYVFTPPEAVEILRGLSERIRAIPDEIAAIAQQKGEA